MKKAEFSLEKYRFDDIQMRLPEDAAIEIEINFAPEGVFDSKNSKFNLGFTFTAIKNSENQPFISIKCIATFQLSTDIHNLETIPDHFYANSIAILFPYVRAFVSTITLQANTPTLLLPTLNLSALGAALRENTILQ